MTAAGTPDPALALEQAASAEAPDLAAMIVEAEKTVRERLRSWPDRIARGRLTLPTAGAKLAAMRRIADTLRWLAANEDWIRAEAGRRATAARLRAEAEELRASEPAVDAVLERFPGAVLVEAGHGDEQGAGEEAA